MFLLTQLLDLCGDERQEARDGAIQILWRSIELYGASLDPSRWETCLGHIIFPLLNSLDKRLEAWEGVEASPEAPLPAKQWDDSKILAVNSAGAVFAEEMLESISHLRSFDEIVQTFIDYLRRAFLRDRPAVATAAMKAMTRVAQIQWPIDRQEQGRSVVDKLYTAWAELGEVIRMQEVFTLTQSNLESFCRVFVAVERAGLLALDDVRVQQLLAVLKAVITYPFSSDYRPDTDVMSPVQALAFDIFSGIDMSSAKVAAWILEDLAEYSTLAFTKLSDTVKSPSLSETHRKQNQKITYVALFKTSSAKIVEVFYRFKDEAVIYESALERVLAVSIVLNERRAGSRCVLIRLMPFRCG